MDTMRSLNTSLPKARTARPDAQPNVHQSFRQAALTVTNLYKSAIADLDRSRTEGYQEALEELIGYMDKQNMGGSEGEGRRIRQWAIERLDGALPGPTNSDSDEEIMEEKRARSSSPAMERNSSPEDTRSSEPPQPEPTNRSDTAPQPVELEEATPEIEMNPPQGMFHFASSRPYPVTGNANDVAGPDHSTPTRRIHHNPRRASVRASRNLHRAAASNLFSLGNGAGHKRKIMQEYFNLDGFNERRDGSGGGKRGRLS